MGFRNGELTMGDKSRKKRPQGKLTGKLKGAVCLLVFALLLPATHGEFLPGTFFLIAQIIAGLLAVIWFVVVIVGSRNHIKRKRAEAEKRKKDEPSA